MRLDEIIQNWDAEDDEQRNNVHIYDPEDEEQPKRPEDASGVIVMLPDNGRD
jgi:hypothetical protein